METLGSAPLLGPSGRPRPRRRPPLGRQIKCRIHPRLGQVRVGRERPRERYGKGKGGTKRKQGGRTRRSHRFGNRSGSVPIRWPNACALWSRASSRISLRRRSTAYPRGTEPGRPAAREPRYARKRSTASANSAGRSIAGRCPQRSSTSSRAPGMRSRYRSPYTSGTRPSCRPPEDKRRGRHAPESSLELRIVQVGVPPHLRRRLERPQLRVGEVLGHVGDRRHGAQHLRQGMLLVVEDHLGDLGRRGAEELADRRLVDPQAGA